MLKEANGASRSMLMRRYFVVGSDAGGEEWVTVGADWASRRPMNAPASGDSESNDCLRVGREFVRAALMDSLSAMLAAYVFKLLVVLICVFNFDFVWS